MAAERHAVDDLDRAERLRAQAADARSFAEHERAEQRRWRPPPREAD